MADPVSWAMIAATAASVGSQVIQGVTAYNQGMAEADAAKANAQIAQDNAARARRDADMAEEAQRREARKALGRAAAAASQSGAAGGGPGQGSMGAMLTQSSKEAELDALNIRYGGETERTAHLTEAAMFQAERKAAIQRAKGGLASGILGAAAAGLSGYSDYRVAKARTRYGSPGSTRGAGKVSKPSPTTRTGNVKLPRPLSLGSAGY